MKQTLLAFLFLIVATADAVPSAPARNNPPRFQIEQVQTDEIEKIIPTFAFKLVNGTQNQPYVLVAKNTMGKEEVLHPELKLNKEGKLVDQDGSPFTLCPLAMGLGEPLSIYAYPKGKKESAHCVLFPRPFITTSNGYTLTLELKDSENKTFSMSAKGFAPNEKVILFSRSVDKVVEQEVWATEHGEIIATLSHSYPQKSGGKAFLEITGNNGVISVNYPWGTQYQKESRIHRASQKRVFQSLASK